MSTLTQDQAHMTRRSFLRTTALLAGGAAVGSQTLGFTSIAEAAESNDATDGAGASASLSKEEAAYSNRFLCTCNGNCGADVCPVWVDVEDGNVVNITKYKYEDEDFDANCARCFANIQREYSVTRIQEPLKRVGERGSGEFEVITWDEAIETICTEWKRIIDEWGPESLVFMPGSGAGGTSKNYYQRLVSYMGGTVLGAMFDQNGQQVVLKRAGAGTTVQRGDDYRHCMEAKNILFWGTNISESYIPIWQYPMRAQENGTKLICIDPVFNTLASHCDEWVPIRPGSDGLLAMGMLQIVLRDQKWDEEFLKHSTVAPLLVKDEDGLYLRLSDLGLAEAESEEDQILVYVDGEGAVPKDRAAEAVLDGKVEIEGIACTTAFTLLKERAESYDLADIAEKTDVPVETIEHLTEVYLDGPSLLWTGFGIDHYGNGYTFYECSFALAMVAGMMGKPGTGYVITDSPVQAQGPATKSIFQPEDAPGYGTFSCSITYDIMQQGGIPGYWEHPIKALYPITGNPIHNNAERGKWQWIYDQLEFVVAADYEMSESCYYADIVLPACFTWEHPNLQVSGSEYLRICEKAIDPLFNSKSDFDIYTLIGRGMGFEDKFTMTEEEMLAASLDNDKCRDWGITWEKLLEEKVMHAFPDEPYRCDVPNLTTKTGLLEFYCENIKPLADEGQEWDWRYEALPYWEPPLEAWPENPLFEKYPIVFTTERGKFKVHSQHSHVPMLLELMEEPTVCINPEDAADRGIEDGDYVRMFNDRGTCVAKCAFHAGVRPGMAVMDHGWDWNQFKEGHYSDLTSIENNRYIPNQNYFDQLIQIEKADI